MATCFVVQGFGEKTDYPTGRKLNLDASYRIIEMAVTDAGHQCVRADQIVHSGTIDQPMYEQLLRADLVIADLSTYNVNAAFELGVRYGLRPHSTIVIAEKSFTSPFDMNHVVIRRYEHLGPDLGSMEAERFRKDLRAAVAEIVGQPKTDSPVYTFLHKLRPPALEDEVERAVEAVVAAAPAADVKGDDHNAKFLLDMALAKINPPPGQPSDFAGAISNLRDLQKLRPNDPFITHQLALATYKSKQPSPREALIAAREILRPLQPATTNDPETLGQWGAIHKRLWELDGRDEDLTESITAYSRGFYLKQDYYNGLNYAFQLERRAVKYAKAGERDEAIADRVLARRVREEVLNYVAPQVDEQADLPSDSRYWLVASMWEACAGLGRADEAAQWEQKARAINPTQWMLESTEGQIANIAKVKAELALVLT